MISNIGIVDVWGLQSTLNQVLGENIFIVKKNENVLPPECFIEYADNTPQQQITQALDIAQTQSENLFVKTKTRLYQNIETIANEQLVFITKPVFNNDEIQQANDWLQNQSQPVPACVSYVALSESISNIDAAQYIVDSKTIYDNLISQIREIQSQGQTAVMNSTNTYTAKVAATNCMEQIKNIK